MQLLDVIRHLPLLKAPVTYTSTISLYVINEGSTGTGGLSAFSIGSGGALTAITSGTFTTGANPMGIAISPNGNYLYVTNQGSIGTNGLSSFSIGSNGSLSPITLSHAVAETKDVSSSSCSKKVRAVLGTPAPLPPRMPTSVRKLIGRSRGWFNERGEAFD